MIVIVAASSQRLSQAVDIEAIDGPQIAETLVRDRANPVLVGGKGSGLDPAVRALLHLGQGQVTRRTHLP